MRLTTLLATLVATAALAGCTHSPEDATTTVQAMGLTDVTLGGYAVFGCGGNDGFHTKFTATNAQGMRVRGVVCGGLLKGNTVRIMGPAS